MNANYETQANPSGTRSFAEICKDCGRKVIDLIENARAAIVEEFRDSLRAHEQMLELALNEAEALAWQTSVPQLVFPTLAHEKAEAVAAWQQRQDALRRA